MIRAAYRSLRRVARRAVKPVYLTVLAFEQRSSASEIKRLADMNDGLQHLIGVESRRLVKLDRRRKEVAGW